ncbi:TonB-dependent receptor [Puniceicoccales bacterium CK1056]|uniref:TonB-dependent receptor n=1 Tax=Oceanipulchritudo coccoides TaxID=2706888 RepID=A0A6B2M583_9BACT|nr:TonB-dependent receptor [Oceanipulchritudo coccoides]NDV63287.1 TonB-dependent receptor [Oceanipulchritudo coccoides]
MENWKRTSPETKGFLIALVLMTQAVAWSDPVVELTAFPVYAGSSLAGPDQVVGQLSERMEREVRVDLQSRGGSRYQNDISIRGGIFEGTGLMVGGLSLFDPQTGHYFSEIPLDPAFFSGAQLYTGVNNALNGFNSTAGSIDWSWAAIEPGGRLSFSLGSDNQWGLSAVVSEELDERTGLQLAVGRESGDGSVQFGDFDLTRVSGRIEWKLGSGTLRIFGGYVDKFYGWPSMYTGISSLNETDHYQVSLVGWQYETRGDRSFHRIGGYWRMLDDDYEFNRSAPNKFFEHETEVFSLQGDGAFSTAVVDFIYRWTLVKDDLISSTSLVNGSFSKREYGELALLGQRRIGTDFGELTLYGGMGIESSDQDSTVGSPQAGARLSGSLEDGSWTLYAEYSESSQVPGYTVLNSGPSGLFGGNPDLGREHAETIEAGFHAQQGNIAGKLVLFQRRDSNLVDWVFSSASPNARQAAPVDITVEGIEAWLSWSAGTTRLDLGYAYLDKESTYASNLVDPASFYALNYARHRLLASAEKELFKGLSVRAEVEYREHPSNALRAGGDEAFRLHLQADWDNFFHKDWRLVVRLDNLTDEKFQPIPGTPGPGREGRATLSYSW